LESAQLWPRGTRPAISPGMYLGAFRKTKLLRRATLSRSTTEKGIVLKREVDVNTRIESESVAVMLLVASELNEGVRDVENVGEPRVTVIGVVSD
jgi:hypothetical protein